ncbi:MAG: putative addiction module antidote protein [Verrucomicrobiaceae bacterium]|nr:MAG: putative addiction module antidote protein [Verrucomicrobiaceae bacterium]
MALKTTPWDSAEYLKSEADISAYLQACFEEAGDDPAFLTHALGVAARARNMSQLARDAGLTREGLYKALSAEGNPSFGTVLKVADAMGYRFSLVSKVKKAVKRVANPRSPKKMAAAKPAAKRRQGAVSRKRATG